MIFLPDDAVLVLPAGAGSQVAKACHYVEDTFGTIGIPSAPVMTFLVRESHLATLIARFSSGVFWLVAPSLVLLAFLPLLLHKRKLSFAAALAIACAATATAYAAMALILKWYGAGF
jgi:hypothetical protein